ncbi:ABC transporter permease [Dactylosporangium sp. NPDC051541]|uniref:ABC transporter permease n=1 Tax=Dactylosporangium sp. NPDC051541 TaxID=3363977 RepID=UPI00379091AD
MYATLFVLGFRRWSAYRTAALGAAFTNCVFGLIRSAVMIAVVGTAGGALAGYDIATTATYVWLGQALIGPVQLFTWTELAQRIRSGDIAVDLARPVDPMLAYLAADLGRAVYSLLPRCVPPLLMGALITGLTLPHTPGPYLLGAVSVAIASALSFACRWLVNLTAFWLLDLRGPMTLYLVLSGVLCGLVVPVRWFPHWLAVVADCTPFPSLLQAPIDVITGKGGFSTVLTQALWLGALLGLGWGIFALGARKLVIQGG